MSRSLPKGEQPWQTFEVRVTAVRGRAEIYAQVRLSYVTGVVGPHHGRPRPLWEGVIATRNTAHTFSSDEAALHARAALERAFPTLF